jgi:hypothetical protein
MGGSWSIKDESDMEERVFGLPRHHLNFTISGFVAANNATAPADLACGAGESGGIPKRTWRHGTDNWVF